MDKLTKSEPALRPATAAEYVDWLKGYVRLGGRITHANDYPMQRDHRLLTAVRDFATNGECGANAVTIIVPRFVRQLHGELGHNRLYFMDGFRTNDRHIVPVYSDPEFDQVPGVGKARAAEAARQAERASEHKAYERELLKSRSDVAAYLRTVEKRRALARPEWLVKPYAEADACHGCGLEVGMDGEGMLCVYCNELRKVLERGAATGSTANVVRHLRSA